MSEVVRNYRVVSDDIGSEIMSLEGQCRNVQLAVV